MVDIDPAQAKALREIVEAERERRRSHKIEKGEAVRLPFGTIVLGDGGGDKIDKAMARRVAELQAAGEKREIIFDDDAIVVTGVPRANRDDPPSPELLALMERGPMNPPVPYVPRADPVQDPVSWSGVAPPTEWKQFSTTIKLPESERDMTGQIEMAEYATAHGLLYVRGLDGYSIGRERYREGDDVLALARKILREKRGGSGFYAPLDYGRRQRV